MTEMALYGVAGAGLGVIGLGLFAWFTRDMD